MHEQVRALWPEAPVAEASPSGRWLRFAGVDGDVVYLQRYAWDEGTRPDFLVVWHGEADERPVAQRRYGDLPGAVTAVRAFYQRLRTAG